MKKFDYTKIDDIGLDEIEKCIHTTSKLAFDIGIENISKRYFYDILLFLAYQIKKITRNKKPTIIGVSGGQGSGKSTITTLVEHILNSYLSVRTIALSIDNFYFSKKKRMQMSKDIHPLCKTRGVPGTHDIVLLKEKINSLLNADLTTKTVIPIFSKIKDDYISDQSWKIYLGKPDIIILEGWCIGAKAIEEQEWLPPLNSLEKNFDPDSTWGKWSNRILKNQYQEIFEMLNILIMIKEKSMRNIYKNRWVQEKTLKKLNKTAKTLTKSDVNQFVMHFERLTRHMFRIMPDYADIIIKKDSNYNYYII